MAEPANPSPPSPGEGPQPPPPGLRVDLPLPWRPVRGKVDGPSARLQAVALMGTVETLGRLPEGVSSAVIGGLARLLRRFERRRCTSARAFIEQALGEGLQPSRREEILLCAWRHMMEVVLSSYSFDRRVPIGRIREHFELTEVHPDFERATSAGTGAILITGHLGDWEALSAITPWLGCDPLYVVSKPPRNRPLSARLQTLRERRGFRLIPREGSMEDALAVLQGGGYLGLMLDQRARTRRVLAPFFGRPAQCERAAAVLIRRCRAPVVVMAAFRTSRPYRFEVRVPAVLWPEAFARRTPEEIATRINQELERLILAHPEQYLWLHDRYRGAPAAMPDPPGGGQDQIGPKLGARSAESAGGGETR